MTKETFVNMNLLYEKLDKPLDDLELKVFWAEKWLSDKLPNEWMPADVKSAIEGSIKESQEAIDLISEIQEIILEFKRKSSNKPARDLQQKSRIRHLNVINGGIYKPTKIGDNDPLLSDEFKVWRKEELAKIKHHDNA